MCKGNKGKSILYGDLFIEGNSAQNYWNQKLRLYYV